MILNLTQHNATANQIGAGITDFPENYQEVLKELLTIPVTYTRKDLEQRALQIHELVRDYYGDYVNNFGNPPNIEGVLIGGMPSFIPVLEATLISKGLRVMWG